MSGQHKSSKRKPAAERKFSNDEPRLGMLVKRAEQAADGPAPWVRGLHRVRYRPDPTTPRRRHGA